MYLDIRQSYLAMFYLLDSFYWVNEDDCLGSLLGGFNPYLLADSMSADPAAWEDWGRCVKKVTDREELTSDEAFRAAWTFVKYHIEEWGFELQWVIDKLNEMSVDSEAWKKCVERALDENEDNSQYFLK